MTHEFKAIVKAYISAKEQHIKTVLATVVDLDGSSYRRPGVRMLITGDGKSIGAVSGGCVEKEVIRQAQSVLKDGIPKMMTYDGRYRLGCEGLLYILIEPFSPSDEFLNAFEIHLEIRKPFRVTSYFSHSEGVNESFGSLIQLADKTYTFRNYKRSKEEMQVFVQDMKPCFKLMIIGAEHDAVQLSGYASLTGWEVTVVVAPYERKTLADFPGAQELCCVDAENLEVGLIDDQTAVMLMTHNYVKDLQFLLRIMEVQPAYLGILGPANRRETLLGELIERNPEIEPSFFDTIYGPSGLNIGAETAQEISIAILAEILAVVRNQNPIMLKNKTRPIHY
ncbi:MAG: XdhC family protein [Maribacter sp.]|uniref:XdhC family protein n=1 Tax=Maribacter sp. TaxID=1897614 RepID=UPI003C727B09